MPRKITCLAAIWCVAMFQVGDSNGETKKSKEKPEAKRAAAALEPRTIELGEAAQRMCTGGAGRYLVFLLPAARRLAVVDLTQQEAVRHVALPSTDVLITAGQERLLVVVPGAKLIHRYNLATLAREKSAPIPLDDPVRVAAMGAASNGPLLLWSGGKVVLCDLMTLRPIPISGRLLAGDPHFGFAVRASADGQTFVGWTTGVSGQRFNSMRLVGNTVLSKSTPDGHSYNECWAMPNADATLYFRYGAGIYGHDLEVIADGQFKDSVLLPTHDRRFFLAVRNADRGQSCEAWLCTTADRHVVTKIPGLEPMMRSVLYTGHGLFRGEPRVRYLPGAGLLVTIPEENDRVVVRPFHWAKELKRTGESYLFVTSVPPPSASVGKVYAYQIEMMSKAGGVKCRLESGPDGMTVSPSGQVRWTPGQSHAGQTVDVLIELSDASGREAFHTFRVSVPLQPALVSRPAAKASQFDFILPRERPGPSARVEAHRIW